jgi:hypothetical protein
VDTAPYSRQSGQVSGSVHGGFEGCRDCLKLRERRGEIFDDLSGDGLGRGEVVSVVERFVTQPGDVEVDLVARDEFLLAERFPSV